ncbi:hypothetical protein JCM9279_002349 [Rhodotorula babjevae]
MATRHDGFEFLNEREPLEPAGELPRKRLPGMIPAVRAQHLISQRMSRFGLSSLHGAANTQLSQAFAGMNGPIIIRRFLEWAVNELVPPQLGQLLASRPAHTPSQAMIFKPAQGDGTATHPLHVVCPALRVHVMQSAAGWVARADGGGGRATLAGPTLVPVAGARGFELTRTARLWSSGELRCGGPPVPFVLDSRSPSLPDGIGAYLSAGAPAVSWRPLVLPTAVLASCPAPPPRSTTFCLYIIHDPAQGPPTHVHVEFDSAFDALVRGTSVEVRSEAARYAPVPRGEGRVTVWGHRGEQ